MRLVIHNKCQIVSIFLTIILFLLLLYITQHFERFRRI